MNASSGAGANPNLAAGKVRKSLHLCLGIRKGEPDSMGVRDEGSPRSRCSYGLADTLEYPKLEATFELFDLLANCRLADADLRSGLGEASCLEDGQEGAEVFGIQLHK